MEYLKPCPNCGSSNGQAIFRTRYVNRMVGFSGTDYGVRCDDCGYEVRGYMFMRKAVEAWYRRMSNVRG